MDTTVPHDEIGDGREDATKVVPALSASATAVSPACESTGTSIAADEAGTEGVSAAEAELATFDRKAFDDAIQNVLSTSDGELLFRMPSETAGDEVAAVRLGHGEAQLLALVILPPGGAPLRVEPVQDSANPLAQIARSYASLVDAWKTAA